MPAQATSAAGVSPTVHWTRLDVNTINDRQPMEFAAERGVALDSGDDPGGARTGRPGPDWLRRLEVNKKFRMSPFAARR